ncbi:MAG: DUF4350 domain-containing protein [Pseudomonadota bacterium]
MSEPTKDSSGPFSARTVFMMLGISIFAFCAVMTLVAFSDDLRPKNRAGSHPYSTAATGYGGLVDLLERTGQTVRVSRVERTIGNRDQGVLIITLQGFGMGELEPDDIQGPALVVLPKWYGSPDRTKPEWQRETSLTDTNYSAGALKIFDEDGEVRRITAPAQLQTPFGIQSPKLDDDLQVIRSKSLEPIIQTAGGAVLSRMQNNDIYILSDPDLVNTFGLAEIDNARFAVDLVNWMKFGYDQAIIFDATLHGFVRSENILQTALSPPFLGATLAALAAALLLGWSASLRFGAPEREDRAIALGKQALADNSAGLISMARRENKLAPGYLDLTRRAVTADIGAPKTLTEEELYALFDRITADATDTKSWGNLAASLKTPAASRDDLVSKAQAIWAWRKEHVHGRH